MLPALILSLIIYKIGMIEIVLVAVIENTMR